MSVAKKTYTIGSVQQLIDLNGDTTNFDCTFNVTSHNKEHFEVLVVDQKTLDSGKDIEYRKVEGDISGNIIQDKDVYDNYYLILKCDKPCKVDVEITKKEIAAKPLPPPPQQQRQQATFQPPRKVVKTTKKRLVNVEIYNDRSCFDRRSVFVILFL